MEEKLSSNNQSLSNYTFLNHSKNSVESSTHEVEEIYYQEREQPDEVDVMQIAARTISHQENRSGIENQDLNSSLLISVSLLLAC